MYLLLTLSCHYENCTRDCAHQYKQDNTYEVITEYTQIQNKIFDNPLDNIIDKYEWKYNIGAVLYKDYLCNNFRCNTGQSTVTITNCQQISKEKYYRSLTDTQKRHLLLYEITDFIFYVLN